MKRKCKETMRRPAMSLSIRAMQLEDVPAVNLLVTDCYRFLAERQGFSAVQFRRLLEERCSENFVRKLFEEFPHYVAESGGRIVGAIGIEGSEVAELWVSPDYHRQGMGRALFRKAEDVIRQAGHAALTVRTTGYATHFYGAMGAHIVGRKPCDGGPLQGWVLTYLEKALDAEAPTFGPAKECKTQDV